MSPETFSAVFQIVDTVGTGVTAALVIVNIFMVRVLISLNERMHDLDLHIARLDGRKERIQSDAIRQGAPRA